MRRSEHSKRGFTLVELVLVIVVLAILVSVTMVQVDKKKQVRLREESAKNLSVLAQCADGMISERGNGPVGTIVSVGGFVTISSLGYVGGPWWPLSLSSSPGLLTPEWTPSQTQELLKSEDRYAFISPAHPKAGRMRRKAIANPESAVNDASYWYMGYYLGTEEAGLAFVDAYRKAVIDTGKPPTGNIEVFLVDSDGNALRTAFADAFRRAVIDTGKPPTGNIEELLLDSGENELSKKSTLLPLYNSRQWMRMSEYPIFIERPGLQRGGSNVLFADGTVRFMKYPGEWPMTEKFIKALESLDELKESSGDTDEK